MTAADTSDRRSKILSSKSYNLSFDKNNCINDSKENKSGIPIFLLYKSQSHKHFTIFDKKKDSNIKQIDAFEPSMEKEGTYHRINKVCIFNFLVQYLCAYCFKKLRLFIRITYKIY